MFGCPSCGAETPGRFCHNCGEKEVGDEDYSVRHYLGEIVGAITQHFQDWGNNRPEIDRVGVAGGRKERVAALRDIPRVLMGSGPWNGITLDSSPLIMRDVGSRELYSLELQLP
jgi:hypothetical protein